jgi:hypothetical protein
VNKVKSTVSAVATLAKQSFVDPVVNGFKAAAAAFKNQVLDPAVDWFNRHVLDPGQQAVSNAKQKAADVLHTAYSYGKQAWQDVKQTAQVAYRSTAAYVQQRTAEIKQKVVEFACNTANKLNDAWQDVKQAVASVPWSTVGKVALMVGGAALTIATLGAAGPVVGTLMVIGLVASTAVDVNDMVADATGTNFIQDKVCGGSAACYTGIELATTALGFVGPGGAAKIAGEAGKLDDVADLAKLGDKAGNDTGFLYRGVTPGHPAYPDALVGDVVPWGGHSDPLRHNLGDNQSVFTSWTTDRDVAVQFATQNGRYPDGVVLRVPDADGAGYTRVQSPDLYDENEVLIQGIVHGAEVTSP